jgi:hypothetical protein
MRGDRGDYAELHNRLLTGAPSPAAICGMGFVLRMFTPDSTFRQQVRLEQAFPGECFSAMKMGDNDERSFEIERAIPGKNL